MPEHASCPFCGEHRMIALEINKDEWIIECVECGAIGPTRSTPEDAWMFWNHRSAGRTHEPHRVQA